MSLYPTLLAKVEAMLTPEEKAARMMNGWPDLIKPRSDRGIPKPKSTMANVAAFLNRFDISIRDDAFRWRYILEGVPLRDQLDDKSVLDFKLAMEMCGLSIGKETLWDALMATAHLRTTHELRELFDELEQEWIDAGKREVLDSWLHDYAYVDDNPYTRAVASKPLIAAVRRVRNPGFPFKYMPVLEGAQDARKSSALRQLGMDKYFDDNLEFGASTKEIMEISSGVLIHEVPELSKMGERQVETVKAMMSRQKDKARMAYGRSTTEMPRQFILWGTSNDRKYLRDPTGSVRFWPVWSNATLEKPINTEGLSKVARLIWGEAAVRERQGESCYMEGEALRLALIAQGERFDGDSNYDKLSDALDGKEGFVISGAVFEICEITDQHVQQSSTTTKSIKAAMTRNGWQRGKRRVVAADGKSQQKRGWFKNCPEGIALLSWWDWDTINRGLVAVKQPVDHQWRFAQAAGLETQPVSGASSQP